MIATSNDIRAELQRAEDAWVQLGHPSSHIVEYWDKWIRAHFKAMAVQGRWIVRKSLTDCFNLWKRQRNGARKIFMLKSLSKLRRQLKNITISLEGLQG